MEQSEAIRQFLNVRFWPQTDLPYRMNEVQQLAAQLLSETPEDRNVLRGLLVEVANATPEKLAPAMNALGRFAVDELTDDPASKQVGRLLRAWQAAIRQQRRV